MIHVGIKFGPCLFEQLEKDFIRLNNEMNRKLGYLCSLSVFAVAY